MKRELFLTKSLSTAGDVSNSLNVFSIFSKQFPFAIEN